MKTWHVENAVVAAGLLAVWALTGRRALEFVGACAVFAGFCHASIAERLREREAARPVPSVECHRKATWFFLAKELAWLVYFVALGAWSALVGCALFLGYPLWRRWWRSVHPMSSDELLARIAADTTDEDADRFLPPSLRRHPKAQTGEGS